MQQVNTVASYIVRIEYKVNYNGVKISGAGLMEWSENLRCWIDGAPQHLPRT